VSPLREIGDAPFRADDFLRLPEMEGTPEMLAFLADENFVAFATEHGYWKRTERQLGDLQAIARERERLESVQFRFGESRDRQAQGSRS
jgi:hypothetical protein